MKLQNINEWNISEGKYTEQEKNAMDTLLANSKIKVGDIVWHGIFGRIKVLDIKPDKDVYKSVDYVSPGINDKYEVNTTKQFNNVKNQGLFGFLQNVNKNFMQDWSSIMYK